MKNNGVDGNSITGDTIGHERIIHRPLVKAGTDIRLEGDTSCCMYRVYLSPRSQSLPR